MNENYGRKVFNVFLLILFFELRRYLGLLQKPYLVLLVSVFLPWFWVVFTSPCNIWVACGKSQSVVNSSKHANSNANVERNQLGRIEFIFIDINHLSICHCRASIQCFDLGKS